LFPSLERVLPYAAFQRTLVYTHGGGGGIYCSIINSLFEAKARGFMRGFIAVSAREQEKSE
jgi:hypothetical protein